MTIRDKLSMFFESLLNEIEAIDNNEIKEKALQGLLTQIDFHLKQVKTMWYHHRFDIKEYDKLNKGETDGSEETI